MSATPLFSVIMVDFEGSVPRDIFRRAVNCFTRQSYQNFELLIYHDGPKEHSYEEDLKGIGLPENIRFFQTEERENVWGHSNRDRGIKAATGEWIIHTNADNIFYDFALEAIANEIQAESWALQPGVRKRLQPTSLPSAYVFPIIMRGYSSSGGKFGYRRIKGEEERYAIVLSGIPVRRGYIDAMQFVMRRDIWLAEGGWSNLKLGSDGILYERFACKYAIRQVPQILGEHW